MSTINHPAHYGGDTVYEAIKVIEAWNLDFCLGNAVKYISRAGKKDPAKEIEDLEKAAWYIQRRIQQCQSRNTRMMSSIAGIIGNATNRSEGKTRSDTSDLGATTSKSSQGSTRKRLKQLERERVRPSIPSGKKSGS